MIAEILPYGVRAVEAINDIPGTCLFAAEQAALGRVADLRRHEFATARGCAHRALEELGFPAVAIVPGPNREPIWPDEVVGSITHCRGYRAAAVAKREAFLSIGIDAEPHEDLPSGILDLVARPEELAALAASEPVLCWDRILFSAKESIYKAWFPLTGQWLGFADAAVLFDPARATFSARLSKHGSVDGVSLDTVEGRFRVVNGFVLTFVGIARQRTAQAGAAAASRL
jgi:4'-phosphopantetheinyl transferase EntD